MAEASRSLWITVTGPTGPRSTRLWVPGYTAWFELGLESADRLCLPHAADRTATSPTVVDAATGKPYRPDGFVIDAVRADQAELCVRLTPGMPWASPS